MAVNRGKQFEEVIKEAFLKVPDVSVVRLHDQTTGYLGSKNHCDFIVYKKPLEYHLECKSVHGNTFPFSNITENQWNGLLEKSKIKGVVAGVIVWFVDKDVTLFVPITVLNDIRNKGAKSIKYNEHAKIYLCGAEVKAHIGNIIAIKGKKKRVFFDYDMEQFFNEVEKEVL